jgi:hypothetical protein
MDAKFCDKCNAITERDMELMLRPGEKVHVCDPRDLDAVVRSPLKKYRYPPFAKMKSYQPPHPYEAIHQWLCEVFGAHPDNLVVTDPQQNFSPVVSMEGLMQILGGEWAECVRRCYEMKADSNDKRQGVVLQTGDAKDGSFMADAVARGKKIAEGT